MNMFVLKLRKLLSTAKFYLQLTYIIREPEILLLWKI